jgi:two-component system CheB/CheR fusion protein
VRAILGYSSEQFVGRHVRDLFTDADQQRGTPQAEMAAAVQKGEAADDRWLVCQDGSQIFVASVVAPLRDPDGHIRGFTKLVRTRTGPIEAARHLTERRDQAEAENREKDALVAVLAHELKQPLNAILGWAHLGATGRISTQRTSEVFGRIVRAADATIQFVNDLLDMSRIASGKLQLALVPANLGDVIQDTVAELAPEAHARGITLRSDTGRTRTVRADPVRFRQVISNLVGNAIKYTPTGGSVSVSSRVEGDHVVLEVADTGVGIARDDLPVIFERFRQSGAADRKQSGLGLGLWVTKRIVEEHGGTLEAFSDGPGRGSRFRVRVPGARPSDEPAEDAPAGGGA